jgi:hypothetical protein
MLREKRHPQSVAETVLGLTSPVVSSGPKVKVSAWRDTDKPKASPKYHLVVKPRGMPEHDFFAMSPEAIKDMADQLLDLHSRLTSVDASTQKLPPRRRPHGAAR